MMLPIQQYCYVSNTWRDKTNVSITLQSAVPQQILFCIDNFGNNLNPNS
jgi:hypothetical protein